MDDDEWAEIEQFAPPQVGQVQIDWRHVFDCLLVRFAVGQRGIPWQKIPGSSTIRMSFFKAVELGTFENLARALPSLNVRHSMWRRVCEGARVAGVARRERNK
jgi:hypothetical protein